MPPISRESDLPFVRLKPREARVAAEVDVLVVGGGPAGIGAAIGAAQAGARTMIAERYGFFGGNATAALVMPLMSFHTQRTLPRAVRDSDLFPTDHTPGDPVIGGALQTLVERLVAAQGALAPSDRTGFTVPFDPEILKMVVLDLLDEAGVHFLMHAFASGIFEENDAIAGAVFETKSGPLVVRARSVVDCTGDGDLAAAAGAEYEIGRAHDGLTQPMTLMFRMVDFQREAFKAYTREHPDQWRGVYGLWDLIRLASDAGELDLPREDLLFFGTPHPGEVAVNSTRVTSVSGTSVWDLTYAEWQSRRQLKQIAAFFRRYVPGFERAYVAQSGVHIGVRETRRIRGEYTLTGSDILEARKFDDVIARSTYPIDIHNPTGPGTVLKRLPPGEAYDIPLRALIPREVDRLLVAGRAISGTHEAHSSYRVMPTAMATGQAAGVCAALAAARDDAPRKVPHLDVQRELRRQGADLRHAV